MNQLQWHKFGISAKANTFIGGVAATTNTPALLATILGINAGRIKKFEVVGSDVNCHIIGSYAMAADAFNNNDVITFFNDKEGLVTSLGHRSFFGNDNIKTIYFKNVVSFGTQLTSYGYVSRVILPKATNVPNEAFKDNYLTFNQSKKFLIYIPNATTLGSSSLDNLIFNQGVRRLDSAVIYVHPSLATSNLGEPDGDITYAISKGATVRYVTNFTPPNPVTSLITGMITATSIQFNFTNPVSSTNAYEFSEIYIKDVSGNWLYISDIASGGVVSGLSSGTTYDFKVVARDIFYNGAEALITVTTL